MHQRTLMVSMALGILACGGDAKDKPSGAPPAAAGAAVSPDEYRKSQQKFADSVLNATQTAQTVVTKLGKGYEVGALRMRDTLAALAGKTDCFANGRKTDPYLAGTVSFFVYMSVVGSNIIRVQDDAATWTSLAGNIVNSCLNLAAKDWKLDSSYGKPAAYITQVQFK